MTNKIQWVSNQLPKSIKVSTVELMDIAIINQVQAFHKSFPEYQPTPLTNLKSLATKIGLSSFFVKDESYRFNLNAFKVLGGSYAMAKYLTNKIGASSTVLNYQQLLANETKLKIGGVTFYTATDGNHGRGIAWTANRLQQPSVVYMPKGSSAVRLKAIQNEGAKAMITSLNYDDTVRMASKDASANKGVLMQDTAWEGYTEIPTWIMQGYGTMVLEALDQMQKQQIKKPTHVFIQAGVGSLAGAVQGLLTNIFGDGVNVIVVEADQADCLYQSALAKDGRPRTVGGSMNTIMAGLACGEPNIVSWEILKSFSNSFVSCPDWVSANGMRILGCPLKNDPQVTSGESGAVTTGLVYELMTNSEYADLKKHLALDAASNVLVFSTEGDTDPEKYRQIVWQGHYSAQ